MRRVVLDAATVLSWFDDHGDGRRMRAEYEAGDFVAVAPGRLYADLLGAAAGVGVGSAALEQLGIELPRIGIRLEEPPLGLVAAWIGRGLPADVAPYAALAEALDVPLRARDERLLRHAGPVLER